MNLTETQRFKKCPKCNFSKVSAGMTKCPGCNTVFNKRKQAVSKENIKHCKVCSGVISKKAATCPRCGEPQIEAKRISSTTITGIDIPFWQLVKFFMKCAIALVPAGIIVSLFWAGVTILSGIFIGLVSGLIR